MIFSNEFILWKAKNEQELDELIAKEKPQYLSIRPEMKFFRILKAYDIFNNTILCRIDLSKEPMDTPPCFDGNIIFGENHA